MKIQKKKALYLRKSRQGEEQDALKTHRATLIELANRHGFDDYDIFEEITSGDSEKEKLNKIKTDIDLYDGVLCMDIDRLSRNKIESFEIELLFGENGVKVYTPSQTYDFADDSQNMMYSFKAIFGNLELKKIKQRMKSGKMNRFKMGEYSIGNPPIGYKIENKRLVIDDIYSETIIKIFELCSSGLGRCAISDEVKLSESHIRSILKNQTYIGNAMVNFYDTQGNLIETLHQKCPQIIDIELFVKVQDELKRRDKNPIRTRKILRSFVQGLFQCTECKNQMIIKKTGQNYGALVLTCHTRHCPTNGIKLKYVEQQIINELDMILAELTDQLKEKLKQSTPSTLPIEIEAIKKKIGKLKEKLNRIKEDHYDGGIGKEEYKERRKNIDSEISDLNLKLQILEMRQSSEKNNQVVKDLERLIIDIQGFENKDINEQHTVLKQLINRIDYSRIVPNGVGRKGSDILYPPTIKIEFRNF